MVNTKRKMMNRLLSLVGVLAGMHILWYVLALLIDNPILPSPIPVYGTMNELVQAGIGRHVAYSLYRIAAGIAGSLVIGLAIGLLMGRSAFWNKLLDPVVYLTYPIPKIALLPVAMLLFGLGETSKILLIGLILVFQIIISVRDAVKAIPEESYDVLTTLGAGSMAKFRHVTLPGALSVILSTVRISLGTAISVLFFTEIYGTQYGMGYFIMDAWLRMDYAQMYAGILVLSAGGFVLFLLVDVLDAVWMKWRRLR
ncbi:ABC transporter permease [Gorillibacterium sp. CAU 1737]|uniref:ABC transporter permease n=1 Tax=Gorillibacterium sp. CAU 1737 TaxID=3140362 RepID=UPI00326190D6